MKLNQYDNNKREKYHLDQSIMLIKLKLYFCFISRHIYDKYVTHMKTVKKFKNSGYSQILKIM